MHSLLVTGGAGFIGSNFALYWAKKYPEDRLVVLDALTYAGNRANLATLDELDSYRFVHGDIGDQALLESLMLAEKTEKYGRAVGADLCVRCRLSEPVALDPFPGV